MFNSTNNNAKVFIPRISLDQTKESIIHHFDRLSIGKITYIDLHEKIVDKRCLHLYAFISVEIYDSFMGKKLETAIQNRKPMRVYYDSMNTSSNWELKSYMPIEERCRVQMALPTVSEEADTRNIISLCKELMQMPTQETFNKADHEAMNAEFDLMLREIDDLRNPKPAYELWNHSVFNCDGLFLY